MEMGQGFCDDINRSKQGRRVKRYKNTVFIKGSFINYVTVGEGGQGFCDEGLSY